MPGSNERALEKARSLPCDGLILDLEDAVAPEAKAIARRQVADAVKAGGFGRREVVVRVNGLDTEWASDDIAAIAKCGADAILFPKIQSAADVLQAILLLEQAGAPSALPIWIMAETPRCILNMDSIAGASPRLTCIVAGTSDLGRELRIRPTPARDGAVGALTMIVLAARAHGLDALDGVHLDLADEAGYETVCAQGRDLGFDGKTLIHPSHIAACNAIFTPPAEEVVLARKIIAAFQLPENASRGAIQLDGRMVERLHADMARRTIAIADAIAAMG